MDSIEPVFLALPPCMVCSDQAATRAAQARGLSALVCDDCLPLLGPPEVVISLTDGGGLPLPGAEEVRAYLAAQTWVYAKTMPKWPHEYVLLRRSTDLWGHLRAVAFIRAAGEKRPWRPGRIHSYWQPGDGTEVWTMREFDTILNRRRLA
jgi:hypothetical protein